MITVIDCETTGLDPNVDRVVEVASVSIEDNEIVDSQSHLFNPGIPIPATASAIHHLTDRHVKEGLGLSTIEPLYRLDFFGTYAAHNAAFDQSFLKWPIEICTKKLAYRLWPDAPGFSNQVLRYWRGITFTPASSRAIELPPHRALHDAFVTAHLLIELMNELDWDIDKAKEISRQPSLLPVVTFGKHAKQKWSEVPKDYLRWIKSQDFDPDVKYTADYWLNA